MDQGTRNIIDNALALEKLEHIWDYLRRITYSNEWYGHSSEVDRDSLLASQRILIAAQAKCRARIANQINGKVYAPDASWQLTAAELPPHYLLIPFDKGEIMTKWVR